MGVTTIFIPILVLPYWYTSAFTSIERDANAPSSLTEEFINRIEKGLEAAQNLGGSDIGSASFPESLLHAGLILAVGITAALASLIYFKRKGKI